jgi:SAM-dependent methyltransferase
MAEYTYILDEADVLRYRVMASRALEQEGDLWDAAGITPGAVVVDLGCGPGAFLADLEHRTAPAGRLVGVDDSAEAVAAARQLVDRLDLGGRTRIVQAPAQATGLDPGTFDVVFIRNLLVHNGPAIDDILGHARRLLGPGGHLFSVEPDVTGLRFPNGAAAEHEMEQRWAQMAQAMGNDPALGAEGRLAERITASGFSIDTSRHRIDRLSVERSPAWTARRMMTDNGFATEDDIAQWQTAITTRLRDVGLLECRLPLSAVLAHPR